MGKINVKIFLFIFILFCGINVFAQVVPVLGKPMSDITKSYLDKELNKLLLDEDFDEVVAIIEYLMKKGYKFSLLEKYYYAKALFSVGNYSAVYRVIDDLRKGISIKNKDKFSKKNLLILDFIFDFYLSVDDLDSFFNLLNQRGKNLDLYSYELGKFYLKNGNYRKALRNFRKINVTNFVFKENLIYMKNYARAKLGKVIKAKKVFNKLQKKCSNIEVADKAYSALEEFSNLKSIKKMNFSISTLWDSNVLSAPDYAKVLITDKNTYGLNYDLNYSLMVNNKFGNLNWLANISKLNNFDVPSSNVFEGNLKVLQRVVYDLFDLELMYSFNQVLVAGKDYMKSIEYRVGFSTSGWYFPFSITRKNFLEKELTKEDIRDSVEYKLGFIRNLNRFTIGYFYARENAEGYKWDNTRYNILTSYTKQLNRKEDLSLSVVFTHYRYDNATLDMGQLPLLKYIKRRDDLLVYNASWGKKLSDKKKFILSVTYFDSDSNTLMYTYKRWLAECKLKIKLK